MKVVNMAGKRIEFGQIYSWFLVLAGGMLLSLGGGWSVTQHYSDNAD